MEKDWKSNIGEYFAKNNGYRLQYLNDNLESSCKEYVSYLREFENIKATVKREPYKGKLFASFEGIKYGLLVAVETTSINSVFFEFRLSCFFNAGGNLIMETTVDCNLLMDKTNLASYEYEEEELPEPEKVEKEYMFELINSRLMSYIATLKKRF